jgi:hypothetical protein
MYAGLIVKGTPPTQPGQGPVIGEIGVPLIARVAGAAIDTGRIDSFTTDHPSYTKGPITFSIAFRNTGNVHYSAGGTITLRANGNTVGTVPVEPALVLPGTVRAYSAQWNGSLPVGALSAHLQMAWDHTGAARDVTFAVGSAIAQAKPAPLGNAGHGVWPWWLLLLVAIPLYLYYRRRRHDDEPGTETAVPVAPAHTEAVVVVPWRVGLARDDDKGSQEDRAPDPALGGAERTADGSRARTRVPSYPSRATVASLPRRMGGPRKKPARSHAVPKTRTRRYSA